MDKQILLVERMRILRSTLQEVAADDPRIQPVLDHYAPFFEAIEAGKIVPPWRGRYRNPIFAKDSAFEDKYGPSSKLSIADAAFLSALEDWPSQAWYRPNSTQTDAKSFVGWRSPVAPSYLTLLFWRLANGIQRHALRLKLLWGDWWRRR